MNDRVYQILLYLDEIGWTELIDSRYKDQVIEDINLKFPDLNKETLQIILDMILV